MNSGEPLLQADFLEAIHVDITAMNTTTRTPVPTEPAIALISWEKKQVELEFAARACSMKHTLLLNFEVSWPAGAVRKKMEFTVTGRVDALAQLDDHLSKVSVSFMQYNQADWDAFLQIFSARQSEVDDFLASARGYSIPDFFDE